MDELEKALYALIKKNLILVKRSKKDPFAGITVQGKRPGKPAISKALRSLEQEGLVRIIKHNWDTTYLPAARTLRKGDDVLYVVTMHLDGAEIDMKILSDRVHRCTPESLKDLDDLLAKFSRDAKSVLKLKKGED